MFATEPIKTQFGENKRETNTGAKAGKEAGDVGQVALNIKRGVRKWSVVSNVVTKSRMNRDRRMWPTEIVGKL